MSKYRLAATTVFDVADIERQWQQLYVQIPDTTVFLDWFWIGSWLRQVKPLNPTCIRIFQGESLIAMGFVCFHIRRVFGFPIKQGLLNRTGSQEFDQTWIEFNDLLVEPRHKNEATLTFLRWCKQQNIDEWIIALANSTQPWLDDSDFAPNVDVEAGYSKRLSADIALFENYVNTLSTNSRSKLRRAKRYLESEFGPIRFETTCGKIPAQQWQHLMRLHRERWQNDEMGSGFDNPHFVEFHEYLMKNPGQECGVETLSFYAGDKHLGYLYNLIQPDSVRFYLSAIDYFEKSNRYQPGLIMHAFAIAHYASLGKQLYDFMGGHNQYKNSLADTHYNLYFIKLSPKTLKNKCLQFLRTVRDKLQQKT